VNLFPEPTTVTAAVEFPRTPPREADPSTAEGPPKAEPEVVEVPFHEGMLASIVTYHRAMGSDQTNGHYQSLGRVVGFHHNYCLMEMTHVHIIDGELGDSARRMLKHLKGFRQADSDRVLGKDVDPSEASKYLIFPAFPSQFFDLVVMPQTCHNEQSLGAGRLSSPYAFWEGRHATEQFDAILAKNPEASTPAHHWDWENMDEEYPFPIRKVQRWAEWDREFEEAYPVIPFRDVFSDDLSTLPPYDGCEHAFMNLVYKKMRRGTHWNGFKR